MINQSGPSVPEETTQLPGPDPSGELHALLAEHLKQTSAVDSIEAEDLLSSVIPPPAPSRSHNLKAVPVRVKPDVSLVVDCELLPLPQSRVR